jgi:hypothetical protein
MQGRILLTPPPVALIRAVFFFFLSCSNYIPILSWPGWDLPSSSIGSHLILTPFSIGLVKCLPCVTTTHVSTSYYMHSLLITLMMEAVHTRNFHLLL